MKMNRRGFIKSIGLGWAYLSLPKLVRAEGYNIRILDQFNNQAAINGKIYLPFGKSSPVVNGIANIAFIYLRGDVNQDGILFGKDDLSLVYWAAARVVPPDSISGDANADGKISANDALRFFKAFRGDSTAVSQQPIAGQVCDVPVSLAGDETYLGVTNYHMRVEKDQIPYVKVFKNGPVIEPYLSRRYADARDLFGKLAGLEMQMVDKDSVIRRWQRIIIDYGQYTFANIDHAAIMRDEARRINEKIGLQLFIEGKNGQASINYTMDRSAVEYTLYDAEGNPAKAIVYKKKYCGAENWSKAEAQRLLLSLAMGINLDDQFFPDEHIAVEKQDARLPDEVWGALKAMYNLPIGIDIKVFERGAEKPAIYVDGNAEINSPIRLVVVVPDSASVPTLEYLVAEKTTREFWSAESADEQPKYQGPGLDGRSHIFTFQTEWPGPRRFKTTVQMTGSQIEAQKDVLVKADNEPGYLRGSTLGTTWWEKNMFDVWGPIENWIYPTLNRMKEMGINFITFVPQFQIDNYTSTDIYPNYDSIIDPSGGSQKYVRVTLTDDEIIKIINCVKDFSMKSMFKPHIFVKESIDGNFWMGTLQPQNGNWDALFESYQDYILHYANLGQQLGVEYISLGTELNSMTLPNWRGFGVPDPDPRWRKIIAEVRKVYNGKLTLSSDSNQIDSMEPSNISQISFWDALDYIGIEPYVVMSNKMNPSLNEMMEGFFVWYTKMVLPTLKKYNKNLFVTESNVYSFHGVPGDPLGLIYGVGTEVDWKQQTDYYNILFDSYRKDQIFEGVNLWAGQISKDNLNGETWDQAFTDLYAWRMYDWIYGKPAEKIIQANWKI